MSQFEGFGYHAGIPQNARAAWGCRAIVDQTGYVDVPPDRTGHYGERVERQSLYLQLSERAGNAWLARATELLSDGEMLTRTAGEHELFNDGAVTIVGNTKSSGGYLYVCAYWNADKEATT